MYFAKRLGYHDDRLDRLTNLLQSQKYKCAFCKNTFMPWDEIELHHVLDKKTKKRRTDDQKQFLHKHCHDVVHA